MLQPRLHSSARSQLASPLSRSLLLSFYCLSISPSTTSSPSNQQTRSASHASQGRANKAAQGPGKRLGAKKSDSELVVPGNIIFRQRGTHWFPGENCGMGRDHTIFALAKGFVRYYRDPGRPGAAGEKKYIGVVFDQTMKLPRGRNEARRRRLGMEMSTMAQKPKEEIESIEDSAPATEVSKSAAGSKNIKTASPPNVPPVTLRPGYTYMESNWSIGRAAERAGVKIRTYKPNNRFLAWRKATLRRAKNAELRGLSRKNKK